MTTSVNLKRLLAIILPISGILLLGIGIGFGILIGKEVLIQENIAISKNSWSERSEYNDSFVTKTFTKLDNENFSIIQFTDLHLDSSIEDSKTLEAIESKIVELNPDLVVYTGDICLTSLSCNALAKMHEKFPFLYWAPVLGNHDREVLGGENEAARRMSRSKTSLFTIGPNTLHGRGNYFINLENELGEIIYTLIFLDSGSNRYFSENNYAYDILKADQISYYNWIVENVSKKRYGDYNPDINKVVPSLVFMHIPIHEYEDAYEYWKKNGFNETIGNGVKRENICHGGINSGFFNAIQEKKSTTHIISGHDHINSFDIEYKNVHFIYGIKTGKAWYHNDDLNGGKLYNIKSSKTAFGFNEIEVVSFYFK